MDFKRLSSPLVFRRLTSTLKRFLLAFAALTLLLSHAQAAEPLPRYKVEVIVFEQLALKGWTEENWPELSSTMDFGNSTSYLNQNQKPLYIKASNTSLTSVVQRLGKGYRPILHEAWTQFAYNSSKSPKVSIEQSNASSSLIGTVKVYKTKFSHIELDLELERRIPSQVREALAEKLGIQAIYLPDTWRFKLQEKRKADSGELHYFDHPLFGALVKIDKL
ncbi:hypothetical protein THMIRHAS_12260 [Thiosulfatimonas sediminis]|uniref:Uncharacterized protein n=1 Tax=Thiosulfatimonas sediminis TaxID=2675054 RepID=A0A6F8PUN8_9GAMM|nr:CsiV family protein [Thiosulfatimonas sediminis]BBP45853.1 hypothetical protein THMIRHAS_12260 [Thiosulfatimonas sediminis]